MNSTKDKNIFHRYGGLEGVMDGYFTPIYNMQETDSLYLIDIELCGAIKDDIIVDFEENTIIIRGEIKDRTKYKSYEVRTIEEQRTIGKFKKSIPVPFVSDIHFPEIKASYRNGLLTIEIPKPTGKPKGEKKRINITL